MSLFDDIGDVLGDVFDSGIGDFIAPGLSFLGGMMSNDSNQQISSANNAFNAQEAANNRKFQYDLYQDKKGYDLTVANSAHQREVQDLLAAGLNPMLSINKGASSPTASAPSGATATSAGNPHMNDIVTPAITTAFQQAQMQNIKEQNNLIRAQVRETESRADQNNATTNLIGAQIPMTNAQTTNLVAMLPEIQERINLLKAQTNSEGMKSMLTDAQIDLTNAETAYKKGQISYQQYTAQIERATARIVTNSILKSDNEAGAQASWWMKNVAPYMPEVLKGGSAFQLYKGMGTK